jgi:hypothetical protein
MSTAMVLSVVVQNCMGLMKNEPDSGNEATLNDGTKEGNMELEESDMKVEQTLDIKEENAEGLTFPTMEAEPDISVWACVCSSNVSCFLYHLLPQKAEIIFNCLYVRTVHFVQFII